MLVTIEIDGVQLSVPKDSSVLEAALNNGIYIPHLCHHPDLPELGACRLCIVEDLKTSQIVPSCQLKAENGLCLSSKTEGVIKKRNMSMELLLAAHPEDCTTCAKYGKCEFQALIQYMGVSPARWKTRSKNLGRKEYPLILHEMDRCVLCGRCVRACNDLRGVGVLDYRKREDLETYVGTLKNKLLQDVDCRFCGACVAVCPTGSIQDALGVFRTDLPREQALVPCQAECPARIDIPAYVRAVKEGRPGDAHAIIREKVPFPLVLGHICNHLCETGCKRTGLNDPVGIRNLKRFAVLNDTEQAWKDKGFRKECTGKCVAVVGSGPCGMTAAYYLNKLGHDVTVMEKRPQLGGPMTSGIPAYRLPIEGVNTELQYILDSGVKAEVNCEVSDVAALKKDYDAVLVAVGVSKGKRLPLPGSDLPEVYTAMDVLADNRAGKDMSYLGETVCVIGGGSVGYDAARSLIRKGMKVNLLCLEQADAILADEDDQVEGAQEGIVLYPGRAFEAIEGDGKVTGLRVHTVLSSTYDKATGQISEVAEEGSQTVVPCDSVIFATGQYTGLQDFRNFGIELSGRGFPVVDGFKTSEDGIFAAGDAITGISFVIKAIQQGREVTEAIDKYLGGDGQISETLCERERDPEIGEFPGFAALPRNEQTLRDAAERIKDDENVYLTYSCQKAMCEAERCLQCDLRRDIRTYRSWNDYSSKGGNVDAAK